MNPESAPTVSTHRAGSDKVRHAISRVGTDRQYSRRARLPVVPTAPIVVRSVEPAKTASTTSFIARFALAQIENQSRRRWERRHSKASKHTRHRAGRYSDQGMLITKRALCMLGCLWACSVILVGALVGVVC